MISTVWMGVVMGHGRPNWLVKASAVTPLIPGHRGSSTRGEGIRRRNIVVGERRWRWRRRAEVVSIVGFFTRKRLSWVFVGSTPAVAWGIGWRIGLSSDLARRWGWRGDRLVIVIFFGSLFATVANLGPRGHVAPMWNIDGDWSSRKGVFVISRRVNVEEVEVASVRRPGIAVVVVGTWVRVVVTVSWKLIIRWRIGASRSFDRMLQMGVDFEIACFSLLGDITGCQGSVVEWSHIVVVFVLVRCLKRFRWR